MRVRHTKLLSLLFSLTTILLHAGEIPTDTLLAHFYNRAANLMEEGHYDEAQRSFDSAFTTRNHKASLKERFRIMSRHYGWASTVTHHLWFVLRLLYK